MFPRDKIDSVVDEWRIFQNEELPDTIQLTTDTNSDDEVEEEEKHHWEVNRIDQMWIPIFEKKCTDGSPKFPNLTVLVKLCLCISHGNADVERSFSNNKMILTSHRTTISDATLNGLRKISSFMNTYDHKPELLPIDAAMLKSVRAARQNYHSRIAAQKAMNKSIDNDVVRGNVKRKLEDDKKKKMKDAEDLMKEGERYRFAAYVCLQIE